MLTRNVWLLRFEAWRTGIAPKPSLIFLGSSQDQEVRNQDTFSLLRRADFFTIIGYWQQEPVHVFPAMQCVDITCFFSFVSWQRTTHLERRLWIDFGTDWHPYQLIARSHGHHGSVVIFYVEVWTGKITQFSTVDM